MLDILTFLVIFFCEADIFFFSSVLLLTFILISTFLIYLSLVLLRSWLLYLPVLIPSCPVLLLIGLVFLPHFPNSSSGLSYNALAFFRLVL